MYKITVNSAGMYRNVALGSRYCFTKKTAISLIDLFFVKSKCDITVEKLVRIGFDLFGWSDCEEDDKVFIYYQNAHWDYEDALFDAEEERLEDEKQL